MADTAKHKLFFYSYVIIGVLCLLIIVISTNVGIAKKFMYIDKQPFGDLYSMCRISTFRISRKVLSNEMINRHSLSNAEVIFIGDSFIKKWYGHNFEIFEKETGIPSFCSRFINKITPLGILKKENYKASSLKYLVFETVERNIFNIAAPSSTDKVAIPSKESIIRRYIVKPSILNLLLVQNPVAFKFFEFRDTFRFYVLNEMSPRIPVYSVSPPMLFYRDGVAFNRRHKTDKDIDDLVNKIEAINLVLQKKYNIKMIFMPVPNKYSIYGYDYDKYRYNSGGEKYDNFLPRLYKKLDKKGIAYIDLYHCFVRNKRTLLYYPTDTHWNLHGIRMAVRKIQEEIYRLSRQNGNALRLWRKRTLLKAKNAF